MAAGLPSVSLIACDGHWQRGGGPIHLLSPSGCCSPVLPSSSSLSVLFCTAASFLLESLFMGTIHVDTEIQTYTCIGRHTDIATQTNIQIHRKPSSHGPRAQPLSSSGPLSCPHVLCEEKKAGRQHTVPGVPDALDLQGSHPCHPQHWL